MVSDNGIGCLRLAVAKTLILFDKALIPRGVEDYSTCISVFDPFSEEDENVRFVGKVKVNVNMPYGVVREG